MKPKPEKPKSKPAGRPPERFKIEGDLGDALTRILNAGKPGSPKRPKKRKTA